MLSTQQSSELFPNLQPGVQDRIAEATAPIAQHFAAMCIYHLFTSGCYDALAASDGGRDMGEVADELGLDRVRLEALLAFLANEGYLELDGATARLTARGVQLQDGRSWYTFLIGGYAGTVAQIGDKLRIGSGFCTRNGRAVGVGSCEISSYDGMPMMFDLMEQSSFRPRVILDLGCGNAIYLARLVERLGGDDVTAWGSEPDEGGYQEALALVEEAGLSDRIFLANKSATDFLASPPEQCEPDLLIVGYVLQEVLAQEGRAAVVEMLSSTVKAFPEMSIIVIEVSDKRRDPDVMRQPIARTFWNPYYLIHDFTNQKLESDEFWRELFDEAGLSVLNFATTPEVFDPTGVELGYLLRRSDRAES